MTPKGLDMVGAEWEIAAHAAPWWVGLGVLLLGFHALWEWGAVKRDNVAVREASAWPAMLAIAALGCIWAGLVIASRDGELPKPQERPIPAASVTATEVPDPSVVASQVPHDLHRVTPLTRQVTGSGRHRASATDRRTAGRTTKSHETPLPRHRNGPA